MQSSTRNISQQDILSLLLEAIRQNSIEAFKFLLQLCLRNDNALYNLVWCSINHHRLGFLKYLAAQGMQLNNDHFLFWAACAKDVNIICFLLDNGHVPSQEGVSDTISTLAKYGVLRGLELLAERGFDMKNDRFIIKAVESGDVKIVDFFVKRGADKIYALYSAAKLGELELVKFLVENCTYTTQELNKAFYNATLKLAEKVMFYLIDVGAEIDYDRSFALQHSVTRNLDLASSLIKRGANTSVIRFDSLRFLLTADFCRSLPPDVLSKIHEAHPQISPPV